MSAVYVRWYDFSLGREDVLEGEVVDNSSYTGTQWQDYVLVRFKPQSMKQPICRHFKPEKVSQDRQNVPHDDCFLIYGKISEKAQKLSKMQEKISMNEQKSPFGVPIDLNDETLLGWIRFKCENWDYKHNHLRTDKLEEFYRIWREQHSATPIPIDSPCNPYYKPAKRIVSDERMEELRTKLKDTLKPQPKKEAVQLSLF